MAPSTRDRATYAAQDRTHRVGSGVFNAFLWITVGNGSALIYTLIISLTLLWWGQNLANAMVVSNTFSVYSKSYLIVQIISALVNLFRRGGSVVLGMSDIGISLIPAVPLLVIGTLMAAGIVHRTWLTDLIMLNAALTIAADIFVSVFYMRATQKTFEGAPHPE